ncbi:MAG: PQQ-binding-like beta-propeller repeat protein [Candidatus Omnitrophica bacterium]|nr:PQQ-binding-like beta-propeller repeat protein [Candidatus Omnitrophota bacterium]
MRKKNPADSAHYATARNIAVASGVFSLIVAALLVVNYIADMSGLPEKEAIYSAQLEEKKALLKQNPRDEELKEEIRRLDLEMRQNFFERKAFSDRGKYLLLIGAAIFLLAAKKIASLQKPARPKPRSKDPFIEEKRKRQARRAVGVMGCIILSGFLALASLSRLELEPPSSEEAVAPVIEYPTKEELQQNWPRFRGYGGLGLSIHENTPTAWDGESGEGILWKTELQLPGVNSPIVWGDRVFLSGADENAKEVYCYSLETGALLWKNPVENVTGNTGEKPRIFEDTGYAASTMACDGARVYAIFPDGDVICFDLDGKRIWARNLGLQENVYGYATSLVFYRNLLLIQYDQGDVDDDLSVLYALEGKTGQTVWRTVRPVAGAWTTPIIISAEGGDQIVTCSDPWVIAYELEAGTELWRADLLDTDLAPSPIFAQGLVFAVLPNETLYAINPNVRGDATESGVVWSKDCPAPDICSPVSNGELIFLLGGAGDLGCYDAKNGELIWEHFFDDIFQASPSIAGGWIYLLSEEGVMYRVKAARELQLAESTSKVDEWVRSSPAFMDGRIVIRGDKNLYCVGGDEKTGQ